MLCAQDILKISQNSKWSAENSRWKSLNQEHKECWLVAISFSKPNLVGWLLHILLHDNYCYVKVIRLIDRQSETVAMDTHWGDTWSSECCFFSSSRWKRKDWPTQDGWRRGRCRQELSHTTSTVKIKEVWTQHFTAAQTYLVGSELNLNR